VETALAAVEQCWGICLIGVRRTMVFGHSGRRNFAILAVVTEHTPSLAQFSVLARPIAHCGATTIQPFIDGPIIATSRTMAVQARSQLCQG